MSPIRIARTLVPALALLALGVPSASAQAVDEERADRLLRQADALEQEMYAGGYTRATRLEAARLHVESAEARPASDAQAVASLRTAARHIGDLDPDRAVRLLVRAAERAVAMGDVESAAHAYIDAAIALKESRSEYTEEDGARINAWHEKADLLSRSPLLTVSQRERLSDRLFPRAVNVVF